MGFEVQEEQDPCKSIIEFCNEMRVHDACRRLDTSRKPEGYEIYDHP